MNKDEMKMIEEMAEMLIDAQDKCELNPCDECEHRGCREGCWHYLSATELYKKGGRIVADDEIVIKKSELARLKNLELNYEQVYEEYRKLEQERKSCRLIADDEVVIKFDDLVERDEKTKKYAERHARKVTAREILQELYNTPHEYHEKKIVELAKAYGVELEG